MKTALKKNTFTAIVMFDGTILRDERQVDAYIEAMDGYYNFYDVVVRAAIIVVPTGANEAANWEIYKASLPEDVPGSTISSRDDLETLVQKYHRAKVHCPPYADDPSSLEPRVTGTFDPSTGRIANSFPVPPSMLHAPLLTEAQQKEIIRVLATMPLEDVVAVEYDPLTKQLHVKGIPLPTNTAIDDAEDFPPVVLTEKQRADVADHEAFLAEHDAALSKGRQLREYVRLAEAAALTRHVSTRAWNFTPAQLAAWNECATAISDWLGVIAKERDLAEIVRNNFVCPVDAKKD